MAELKLCKCPFCGSKHIKSDYMTGKFWLVCDDCGSMGPNGKNLEQAIDAWNKRS